MEDSGKHGFINKYNRDYYGGGLMLLIGLGAIREGLSYKMGTLVRMGPGFFPVALGVLLALVGVAIVIGAKAAIPEGEEKQRRPEWRGWFCIVLGIFAFIGFGKYGGLLPATFAVVFISALGDRDNNVKSALLLALGMCAACTVVFWWALQVQFPLFQWG
ncbi:MAG: tripartite tricarboxylate transporter TctB family protein [Massilia sp.]|jgi:hypothetical protein|nr:tripartite tricarboxylate transporter TctB family protein [Massilia sp.]